MEGLKICTLDEFLDVFVGTSTRPQIEIKTETYDTLGTVVDAVVKKGMAEQSIVISFDLEQLRIIHNLNPDIELWYLVGKITPECIAEAKALSEKVWLSPCYDDNDEEDVYSGEEFDVEGRLAVNYSPLYEDEYMYSFCIDDIYGDYYMTDPVVFSVDEDGEVSFVE
jgi:hypothetical protein